MPLPSPIVPIVEATPPPIMVPAPPPIMVPIPPSVIVPTPPPAMVPTPPPVMVPTPRPPLVPIPPSVMVKYEQGSCVGPSDPNANPITEDTIRTQCWVEVVGGKNKGRVYEACQLAINIGASGSLKHQPSSSTSCVEDVTYLKQRLKARVHNLVLTLLPPSHHVLQQPQSNLTLS
ncbi:hypothetical protein DEO72_LG8g2185 [Vigna unguiculata]|uniref:Uncharacterized protein n=1 Tax=Vigna unguiculata TaxID=3917 RepID=A0A4D6MU82_VIGUN|nr:hypothetical protein DEO72_LG8g2185 [Vigna unguiculata]